MVLGNWKQWKWKPEMEYRNINGRMVQHLTCKQNVVGSDPCSCWHFFSLKSYLLHTHFCYQLLRLLLLGIQTTYGGGTRAKLNQHPRGFSCPTAILLGLTNFLPCLRSFWLHVTEGLCVIYLYFNISLQLMVKKNPVIWELKHCCSLSISAFLSVSFKALV